MQHPAAVPTPSLTGSSFFACREKVVFGAEDMEISPATVSYQTSSGGFPRAEMKAPAPQMLRPTSDLKPGIAVFKSAPRAEAIVVKVMQLLTARAQVESSM